MNGNPNANIPFGYNTQHDAPVSQDTIAREMLAARGWRLGATRTYRPTPLSAALAAGGTSSPITVTFRRNGIVTAMYGQVLGATAADMTAAAVRVTLSGQEELFTDGENGTFLPFYMAFGQVQNWYPLSRYVYVGQQWTVTYRSEDSGGSAITPSVAFSMIEEEDPTVAKR